MSAARRHQQYMVDDDAATHAIATGAQRTSRGGDATSLHALPRGLPGRQGGRTGYVGREVEAPRRAATLDTSALVRLVGTAMIIGALAVVLYFGLTSLLGFVQEKRDDLRYGNPRTSQADAFVGHGEAAGVATHFMAINLNRRITILEFPGGDLSQPPRVFLGPQLFGRADDLTVAKIQVDDLNGDGKRDFTVQVKDVRLAYINDGTTFRPITTEELAQLKQQEGGR